MALDSRSVGCFLVIFLGYKVQSALLTYHFYVLKADRRISWKIQRDVGSKSGTFWGDPLFSSKPNRAPLHRYVTALNLFVASSFAAATCELAIRGSALSKLMFDIPSMEGTAVTATMWVLRICGELLGIVIFQSVVEYLWHRLMHLPFFYSRFHKMHHFYKAPEPFDDLYIHPVEAFGYYCILYSPTVLFPVNVFSFLAYMVIMGVCGVADHSGIKLQFPFFYDSEEHDNHHKHFNYNYGFPFNFMDKLANTYYDSK